MVYCAGLNSTFHQFLRPRRSEAVEATATMMIAGQRPQTKSIAQVNAVDMTTPSGSWPRPWMRGSSSSTTSRNAVMSNGATSWTLEVVITLATATASSVQLVAPLLMTAFLLVVLELLPLIQGRGHDPQGVVMSTAFTCAMLFVWGVWPAIIMIAVASTASDLRGRKNWWKVLFNPAQYTISVAAAYLVMLVAGNTPSLAHPLTRFNLDDMVWIVGVWIVYFAVNLALVAGVLTWTGSFRNVVADGFVHYTAMTF